jgi:hypothetical protein
LTAPLKNLDLNGVLKEPYCSALILLSISLAADPRFAIFADEDLSAIPEKQQTV